MTREQLKALKEYIEAKIREMDRASVLEDAIRLSEAEHELELEFIAKSEASL